MTRDQIAVGKRVLHTFPSSVLYHQAGTIRQIHSNGGFYVQFDDGAEVFWVASSYWLFEEHP